MSPSIPILETTMNRSVCRNFRRRLLLGIGLAGVTPFTASLVHAQRSGSTNADQSAQQSAANLAVLQRYVAALRTGSGAKLYHPEFTTHYFGDNPFAGDHVGKDAAVKTLSEFNRRVNRKILNVVDVLAGSKFAAMITRESFERNGERVELERVLVYTVKDGLLEECWVYDRNQRLVDRL